MTLSQQYQHVHFADGHLWQQAGSGGPAALSKLCRLLSSRNVFESLARILLTASMISEEAASTKKANSLTARGGVASTSASQSHQQEPKQEYGPSNAAVAAFTESFVNTLANFGTAQQQKLVLVSLLCVPFLWSRSAISQEPVPSSDA